MTNSVSDLRDSLDLATFQRACVGWLLHGELQGWTQATRDDRVIWLRRLEAFLRCRDLELSTDALRAFFVALSRGDRDAGCRKRLRPASVKHVHALLKSLGTWLVDEEYVSGHLMRKIPAPILRDDRARTLTDEELSRVFEATKHGRMRDRDAAIVAMLIDTGARAGEICGLRMSSVDLSARTAVIAYGKGGKRRTVAFGTETAHRLWRYFRNEVRTPEDFVFQTERGRGFTVGSMRQMIHRIAKVSGVPVYPHLFRHDSAVRMLRNGANAFAVQVQLGHSHISTTQVYVQLSEADVCAAHRTASPLDNLGKQRNRK